MSQKKPDSDGAYLFQVDVMLHASSNGAALEQLLRVLNSGNFADYRIGSGIRLGSAIEQALAQTTQTVPIPIKEHVKSPGKEPVNAKPHAKEASKTNPLEIRIRHFIQSNQLIRLNINKGRGVKMSLPCRVVNYDPSNQMLTVYHVDEKQVYTVLLNEIDDFIE
ncbi:hypothetical protein [Cohnella panacarvi]|uniref:hypothetical protein n=1 Tax=Cohnella panacarvi TaxID=400776 RepID=UPI00047A9131|nr:hypothetical protein [Cohnella panacarvi]